MTIHDTLVHPPVAPSQTDPFAAEPSNVAPVTVRLTRRDGTTATLTTDARALTPLAVFRHGGRLYLPRGAEPAALLLREATLVPLDDAGAKSPEATAAHHALAQRALAYAHLFAADALATVAAELAGKGVDDSGARLAAAALARAEARLRAAAAPSPDAVPPNALPPDTTPAASPAAAPPPAAAKE